MSKKAHLIDTPLGPMIAEADEEALYRLEFGESTTLEFGRTPPIDSVEKELRLYFAGKLSAFQTPIKTIGSPFQKRVWEALQKIPFGKTCSYAEIAQAIQNPLAVRAVGSANGCNPLAIIIPCHRVIRASGELGGYASGIEKKNWLLSHERKYFS